MMTAYQNKKGGNFCTGGKTLHPLEILKKIIFKRMTRNSINVADYIIEYIVNEIFRRMV